MSADAKMPDKNSHRLNSTVFRKNDNHIGLSQKCKKDLILQCLLLK
jgi:hypothetical protein